MRRLGCAVLAIVIVASCLTLGFFINEFIHLREENLELKRLASESLSLAEDRGNAVSSCLSSLNSCSRVLTVENPQIQERLLREPEARSQFAQQRGK